MQDALRGRLLLSGNAAAFKMELARTNSPQTKHQVSNLYQVNTMLNPNLPSNLPSVNIPMDRSPTTPETHLQAQAQTAATPGAPSGGQARPPVELLSKQALNKSVFNESAGVTGHQEEGEHSSSEGTKGPKKTLAQRMKQVKERRNKSTQKSQIRGKLQLDEDEDNTPFLMVAAETLSTLSEKGPEEMKKQLEEGYDPLQSYVVLHNALCDLEDQPDMPLAQKEVLKQQLNDMMADMMKNHRDEIRSGLKNAGVPGTTVSALTARTGPSLDSLQELRHLYGAKGKGVFDSPLAPLVMAKTVLEKSGPDNFVSAMRSLRSKMATEFRSNPVRGQGLSPRFWLCMSDATAFSIVSSTVMISSELRNDLVTRASIRSKKPLSATTITLLSIPDTNKTRGSNVVSQIVDVERKSDLTKGRIYGAIRDAVEKMPASMWPFDRTGQRLDLVADLDTMVGDTHKTTLHLTHEADRRERELNDMWATKTAGAASPAVKAKL